MQSRARQPHTEECRKRMMMLMSEEEKVKEHEEKMDEYCEEAIKKDEVDRKRAKEEEDEAVDNKTKKPKGNDQEVEQEQADSGARGSKREAEELDEESDWSEDDEELEKEVAKRMRVAEIEVDVGEGWTQEGYDAEVKDEKTGEGLDQNLVAKAQMEEVTYMEEIEMHEERSVEECQKRTGKPPVSTKWVNTNKGEPGWGTRYKVPAGRKRF